MSTISKPFTDYLNKKSLGALFKKQGWNLNTTYATADTPNVFIYVVDVFDTGEVALIGSTESEMIKAEQAGFSNQECSEGLGFFLKQTPANKFAEEHLASGLASAACLYLASTKTWAQGKSYLKQGYSMHAVILNYSYQGSNTGNLRPFACFDKAEPFTVERLAEHANQTVLHDRLKMPHLLPSAEIKPFKM